MVWLHNVCGVPENVTGDVRRVMINPLKYIHLEGEGEALSAMILFRNGRWSAGRGQEELFQLMLESGMIDDWGPFFDSEKEAEQSLNSSDEGCITDPVHIAAYEDWVSTQEQDIYQPSYFSDYADNNSLLRDDRGNVVNFSPEMLEQREQLNWNFNFLWNGFGFCEGTSNHPTGDYVPPIYFEDVEIVTVGDNHGVGKCKMGSVFIPKGSLNYLGPNAYVGQGIQATLERANEGARYPWRIVKDGITCVGITYAK